MGKSMIGMTTRQMEKAMAEGLLARGYVGRAKYIGDEIHIGFHLSGGVTMHLTFPADVTPAQAVLQSSRILDKLNGK